MNKVLPRLLDEHESLVDDIDKATAAKVVQAVERVLRAERPQIESAGFSKLGVLLIDGEEWWRSYFSDPVVRHLDPRPIFNAGVLRHLANRTLNLNKEIP